MQLQAKKNNIQHLYHTYHKSLYINLGTDRFFFHDLLLIQCYHSVLYFSFFIYHMELLLDSGTKNLLVYDLILSTWKPLSSFALQIYCYNLHGYTRVNYRIIPVVKLYYYYLVKHNLHILFC